MFKNKDIYIVSVATEEYFNMVKGLIASSVLNFKKAKFIIVLVNLDESYSIELLKISKNIEFIYEKVYFETKKHQFLYCTNRRATLLKELSLNKRNDILIWLDADSVFKKEASEFYNEIIKDDYSIAFFDGGKLKNGQKRIMGGLIVVDTEKEDSKLFLDMYAKNVPINLYKKAIKGKDGHNKKLRQNQLYLRNVFIIKYKNNFNIKFFDYRYMSTVNRDNIIWSPDLKKKYCLEYQNLVNESIRKVLNIE